MFEYFHILSCTLSEAYSLYARLLNHRNLFWQGRTISQPVLLNQKSPLRPQIQADSPSLNTALQAMGSAEDFAGIGIGAAARMILLALAA